MTDKNNLNDFDKYQKSEKDWQETTLKKALGRFPERSTKFMTTSSVPIDRLYAPQDMDYDRDGEACYLAAIGHTMPSRLYAIDLDTGNASFIAPIQNGMEITGLAIPYGLAQTGILAGTITLNGGTGNVEEVAISIENEVHYPDENGYFSFDVDCGTYDISFLLTGYESQTIEGVVIHEEETTNINITLEVETGEMNK